MGSLGEGELRVQVVGPGFGMGLSVFVRTSKSGRFRV